MLFIKATAAKECRGTSGRERTNCINNRRRKALKVIISNLKKFRPKCAQGKHPKACEISIDREIRNARMELAKIGDH